MPPPLPDDSHPNTQASNRRRCDSRTRVAPVRLCGPSQRPGTARAASPPLRRLFPPRLRTGGLFGAPHACPAPQPTAETARCKDPETTIDPGTLRLRIKLRRDSASP